jgi:hypothetical protein
MADIPIYGSPPLTDNSNSCDKRERSLPEEAGSSPTYQKE